MVTKFGGDINRIRVDTSPNFLSRGVAFSSTTFTSFVQHSHSTLVEAGTVIPSRQHHFPTHSFSLNTHSSSHFSSEDLLLTAQTFKLRRWHNVSHRVRSKFQWPDEQGIQHVHWLERSSKGQRGKAELFLQCTRSDEHAQNPNRARGHWNSYV